MAELGLALRPARVEHEEPDNADVADTRLAAGAHRGDKGWAPPQATERLPVCVLHVLFFLAVKALVSHTQTKKSVVTTTRLRSKHMKG